MLKEFVESIVGLGRASQAATPVELKNPRQIGYVIGGVLHQFSVAPPLVRDTIESLEDFVAVVGGLLKAAVFHSHTEVIALVDQVDRRERITLPLMPSAEFAALEDLSGASGAQVKQVDQKQLIRLLKTTFRDRVPPTLRGQVSKIEVLTNQRTTGEIGQGRERGSREFAIEGAAEVPETVTVTVSVYQTHGLVSDRPIPCSLDVDVRSSPISFAFAPMPGALARAITEAQRELHELLVKAMPNVPVIQGTPD